MRIGVFVCRCGTNIAGTVDTQAVAAQALTFPDVVYATELLYTCSEPGQQEIQNAVLTHGLQGVVVAACSPRMHELTFRRAVEKAGLNRYLLEMANIREHVSWIGLDKAVNTEKAAELVRMAVAKVGRNEPLFGSQVPVTKRVMVIGGGVAGIQAALDCAEAGVDVVLVEREPSIGGKMAKLDKTFPTIDCSSCILGPKMVDVAQKENITLHAATEVESLSGAIGNFTVTLRKKATYVDWNVCTGCGLCMEKCPSKKNPDGFNERLGAAPAIRIPFPQAIPKKAHIERAACRYFSTGKCRVCQKICPVGAVRFDMEDEEVVEQVGAVIVATGYDLFDPAAYGEYGAGRYPDVITGMQFERILSAPGPSAATFAVRRTAGNLGTSCSSPAWDPETNPWAVPTARACAAWSSPSRPFWPGITCRNPAVTSSTWIFGLRGKTTTNSSVGLWRNTGSNTSEGAWGRSTPRAIGWSSKGPIRSWGHR